MIVTADKTNVSVFVYFVDDAGGTNPGEPTTGLLFSDIETGGTASYARQGAARVDLTLITLASASTAHADGGFILVDDTNMPGLYRVDYPDAAFASGVDQVVIQMVAAGANNTVMRPVLVDLKDVITLPGQEAPPLAPTEAELLGWLYKMMRNRKDNDGTTAQLYADDESTVDAKSTVTESGGTVTQQEWVTGP